MSEPGTISKITEPEVTRIPQFTHSPAEVTSSDVIFVCAHAPYTYWTYVGDSVGRNLNSFRIVKGDKTIEADWVAVCGDCRSMKLNTIEFYVANTVESASA